MDDGKRKEIVECIVRKVTIRKGDQSKAPPCVLGLFRGQTMSSGCQGGMKEWI